MPTINKPKRKTTYIRHTDNAKAYDYKWTKLRNSYFMTHPLCERCLLDNKTVPGEEVHHIKPISTAKSDEEREALLLDSSNLMTLCKECHHKLHESMRKVE